MLASQVQKGPHDFFFFYFHSRTQFAMEPIQTLLGKKGTSSGAVGSHSWALG